MKMLRLVKDRDGLELLGIDLREYWRGANTVYDIEILWV